MAKTTTRSKTKAPAKRPAGPRVARQRTSAGRPPARRAVRSSGRRRRREVVRLEVELAGDVADVVRREARRQRLTVEALLTNVLHLVLLGVVGAWKR